MLKCFSNYNALSDEELMTLVAAGKTAGLNELYNRYNNKLLLIIAFNQLNVL